MFYWKKTVILTLHSVLIRIHFIWTGGHIHSSRKHFFLIILKYFNTICQLSDILKRRLQSYHNVSHQKFLVKASSLFQTNRIIKYQISPLFQERSLKDMHSSSVEVSPHLPKGSKARTYNLVYTPVPQQKITGMILQCQLTDSSRYSGKLSISAANKSNS